MNPNNQQRPPDPLTNLPHTLSISTNLGGNPKFTSKAVENDFNSQFKLAAEAFHHLKSFQSSLSGLNSTFDYDSSVNFSLSNKHMSCKKEVCQDDKKSISINFDMDTICSKIVGPLAKVSIDFLMQNASLCGMLIDNPFLADAKIIINKLDEYTYYVHKNVLMERSLYFNCMLSCDFKEGSEEYIHLELIHPESFHSVLYYLYTEKLPSRLECDSKWRTTKDEYYNLLWTGNYLQMDFLTNKLVSMFDFTLIHCDKFHKKYFPLEQFLKRMTASLSQTVAKGAKDNAGKCVKCKVGIGFLETVLLYASNSEDAEVCKSVIDWTVRHNLSKHVKTAKFTEKISQLSPLLRDMIDPLGMLENNQCRDDLCSVRDLPATKHGKNSRHNGLVMIAGHCL